MKYGKKPYGITYVNKAMDGARDMKRILNIVSIISGGMLAGIIIDRILLFKLMKEKEAGIKKYRNYFNIMSRWLLLKSEGIKIEDFFLKYDYHTIAIYGMGALGKHLFNEIKNSSITVDYVIDRNERINIQEIEVLSLDGEIRNVDAIVVTVTSEFEELRDNLQEKNIGTVISLETVIFDDMWNE